MNEVDLTFLLLQNPRLAQLAPLRILMRRTTYGAFEGYVEGSFDMAWARNSVMIYYTLSDKLSYRDAIYDAVCDANYMPGSMVIDPLSKDCPVTIDWPSWLHADREYPMKNALFFEKIIKSQFHKSL